VAAKYVQFNRYVNVSALKHYFNVSNAYVVNKLFLVLFPWRHKPWSRKQSVGPNGQEGWFLPPREDLNSPDMYIPGRFDAFHLILNLSLIQLYSYGLRDIYSSFHPPRWPSRRLSARVIRLYRVDSIRNSYIRDIRPQIRLLSFIYIERVPTLRSGGLFRL
jgi:hypothetical protein